MQHDAELRLECPSSQAAIWILAAVSPELEDGPEGATCDVKVDGSAVVAKLSAPDVSTLRAAINTVTRLVDAAQRSAAAGAI